MNKLEYLKHFHEIDTADYDLLTKNMKSKSFKKLDFITVPGQIKKELYFVKGGIQMSYLDAEHKTHVIAFTSSCSS